MFGSDLTCTATVVARTLPPDLRLPSGKGVLCKHMQAGYWWQTARKQFDSVFRITHTAVLADSWTMRFAKPSRTYGPAAQGTEQVLER